MSTPAGTVHGLIATARGMCTDEWTHEVIDAQLARAVDAVKDLEAERDCYQQALTLIAHPSCIVVHERDGDSWIDTGKPARIAADALARQEPTT